MMTPLDPQRIRSNFSSHAGEYDRYALVQQRVVSRLLELLDGRTVPTGPCLEIGTGTGRLSQELMRRHPSLRPVLSDLAHGMTRHAAGRLPALAAVDADAAQLPFVADSFELLYSSSVYQWIEDLAGAFAEARRVLRPGGVLLLALFGEKSLQELKSAHRQAMREAGRGQASHVQNFPTAHDVGKALQGAGFGVDQLLVEEEWEVYPDVLELLRSLKRIGAGNASTRRPPGLASRAVMQRMFELYRHRYAAAEGVRATWQVIYVVARRPG